MATRNPKTIKIMKAYFDGGNAKEKASNIIEKDLRIIQKVVEEQKEEN